MNKKLNKKIGTFAFCFMALIGTYNAVMINSESSIGDLGSFKRLDEVYGVVKEGRAPAVVTDWKKVSKSAEVEKKVAVSAPAASVTSSASDALATEASIQEDLNLKLVEVINAQKWSQGVSADQFSGSIVTNYGIIESLVASLPENKNIEISFSEMNGNVFEYDLDGEVYSGMMYQVDQSAYMVTLTNGPLEGTRLRFAGETQNPEAQQAFLAETHNVEVQSFGSEAEYSEAPSSDNLAAKASEVAAFNFNI